MTPQQIVGFGVRLYAIWLVVSSIPYLIAIPGALAQHGLEGAPVAYSLGVIYLVVAIFLWAFPMTVAHKLVPRTQFTEPLRVAAFDAARVGCALLGLWLLIRSGPGLVSLVFRAYVVSGSGPVFSGLTSDQKLDIGIYVLEILIAVVLLVRSASFARFVTRESTVKDSES
jgi:hypothetical protein